MDWRLGALRRSLGIRLVLPLSVTVGVVLAAHALMSFRSTQDHFLRLVHADVERSSDLIKRATHDGMLLNRLDEVQATIEHLANGPDVAAIRVYDKEGVIVLSAHTEEIGQRIDLGSETCRSCHEEATQGFVTFQPHGNTHDFTASVRPPWHRGERTER